VENLVAYVFAMARNEAVRHTERRAREPTGREALSQRATHVESNEGDVRDVESAEWVAAALARISPEQREIVELKIHADLTFREISEVTGLPPGTVATRYRTALEKLRGQITRDSS
jgi:RNA polymerase sigma-70 factor, ECF subfamily